MLGERERPRIVPGGAAAARGAPVGAEPVRYRPCPDRGTLMNRVNFGRASGVIVDGCQGHGTWCAADEPPRILAFVRAGGLGATQARGHEGLEPERRHLETLQRVDARMADFRPRPAPVAATSPIAPMDSRSGWTCS